MDIRDRQTDSRTVTRTSSSSRGFSKEAFIKCILEREKVVRLIGFRLVIYFRSQAGGGDGWSNLKAVILGHSGPM